MTTAIIGRSNSPRVDDPKAGRRYQWTAQTFPSVTTIIGGGVPKPALLPWGIKMVAEAAVAMTESHQLAAMVKRDAAAALKALKEAPYVKRDGAADLGSAIHDAAERHILGLEIAPLPDAAPYVAQLKAFLAEYEPEYLAAECTVFSREHGYAGTLDGIVKFGDVTYLVDYKTGTGVYPEAALQLAAYAHAEFIGLPDGTETPLPKIDGALVLWLQPESYEVILARCDDEVFGYFLAAKRVWLWQTEIGKNAIGKPAK